MVKRWQLLWWYVCDWLCLLAPWDLWSGGDRSGPIHQYVYQCAQWCAPLPTLLCLQDASRERVKTTCILHSLPASAPKCLSPWLVAICKSDVCVIFITEKQSNFFKLQRQQNEWPNSKGEKELQKRRGGEPDSALFTLHPEPQFSAATKYLARFSSLRFSPLV